MAEIARTVALLLRRRDHGSRSTDLIAVIACAVATLVLLVGLSAVSGAQHRDLDPSWQHPVITDAADADGLIAVTTSAVRERSLTIARVAPDEPGRPGPDGLTSLPGPGVVLASPALISLAASLPADQLADRVGGDPADWQPLPASALATPDDLAAVVGVAPDDPRLTPSLVAAADDPAAALRAGAYAGFRTPSPEGAARMSTLVIAGVALLLVPVLTLMASSVRLGAARRRDTTARLRLAGGGPRLVRTVVGVQAAGTALLGALAGTVAHLALLPLLAQVPFGGRRAHLVDLTVPLWQTAAVLVLATGVGTVAAVHGVASAVREPWEVAQRQRPGATRLRRLLLVLAGGGVLAAVASTGRLDLAGQLTVLVLAYGLLGLVGAFVVDLLGRLTSRTARTAPALLAGRRLADDPRAVWRQIGGLALAGFVAGLFGGASPIGLGGETGTIALPVRLPQASVVAEQAQARLAGTGLEVTSRTADGLFLAPEDEIAAVAVRGADDPAAVDRALTALDGLVPGQPALVPGAIDSDLRSTGRLLREIALGTLALSALLAAASTGCTAATAVLDRRDTYRSLRLAGVSLRTLDRARLIETLVPLAALITLMTGAGLVAADRLNTALGTTTDGGAIRLVVVFAATATLGSVLALRVSSPLLRRTSTPGGTRA